MSVVAGLSPAAPPVAVRDEEDDIGNTNGSLNMFKRTVINSWPGNLKPPISFDRSLQSTSVTSCAPIYVSSAGMGSTACLVSAGCQQGPYPYPLPFSNDTPPATPLLGYAPGRGGTGPENEWSLCSWIRITQTHIVFMWPEEDKEERERVQEDLVICW